MERERQEVAGETPRYINEYLGMSEDEKQPTLQSVRHWHYPNGSLSCQRNRYLQME